MACKTAVCDSGRDPLPYDKRARSKIKKDREPAADGKRKTEYEKQTEKLCHKRQKVKEVYNTNNWNVVLT